MGHRCCLLFGFIQNFIVFPYIGEDLEESAGCIIVVGAWFIWNVAPSEPDYGKYLSSGVCEHS